MGKGEKPLKIGPGWVIRFSCVFRDLAEPESKIRLFFYSKLLKRDFVSQSIDIARHVDL